MKSINVLIADSQAVFRAGLRTMLDSLDHVQVVAEAADGREVLRLIEHEAVDLILTGVDLHDMSGIELTRAIVHETSIMRVVIVGDHGRKDIVRRVLRAGALGYLVRDSSHAEFALAVHAALRGQIFLSPAVTTQVVEEFVGRCELSAVGVETLSPRQLEVLRLVSVGCSTKQVARRLGISVKTAETHRSMLMMRLGVHNVADLVQYAVTAGVIDPVDRTRSVPG